MGNCFSYPLVNALHSNNAFPPFIEYSLPDVLDPSKDNGSTTRKDQTDLLANSSKEEEESRAKITSPPKKIATNEEGIRSRLDEDEDGISPTRIDHDQPQQTLYDIVYTVYLQWQLEYDMIWSQKLKKMKLEYRELHAFFKEKNVLVDVLLDCPKPLQKEKMRKPSLLEMEEYHRYCALDEEFLGYKKEITDMKKKKRHEMYNFLGDNYLKRDEQK